MDVGFQSAYDTLLKELTTLVEEDGLQKLYVTVPNRRVAPAVAIELASREGFDCKTITRCTLNGKLSYRFTK